MQAFRTTQCQSGINLMSETKLPFCYFYRPEDSDSPGGRKQDMNQWDSLA